MHQLDGPILLAGARARKETAAPGGGTRSAPCPTGPETSTQAAAGDYYAGLICFSFTAGK